MLSSVRYLLLYRKHNTASHSAIIPTQSSKPTTCRSERDNARKQTELARTSMSSSNYTARCALKTNEEIKICPVHQKYIQPLTKQFTVCTRCYDPRKTICLYFLSQCVTYNALYLRPLIAFRACTRRPGCFLGAWSSWHKEVVSSHLKSWTFLFVSCAFCYSSL